MPASSQCCQNQFVHCEGCSMKTINQKIFKNRTFNFSCILLTIYQHDSKSWVLYEQRIVLHVVEIFQWLLAQKPKIGAKSSKCTFFQTPLTKQKAELSSISSFLCGKCKNCLKNVTRTFLILDRLLVAKAKIGSMCLTPVSQLVSQLVTIISKVA